MVCGGLTLTRVGDTCQAHQQLINQLLQDANEAYTAHPHSLAVTRTRMPVTVAGAPRYTAPGYSPVTSASPSVQRMEKVACGSL